MADTVLYQMKKQSEVYWRLWEETKDPFLLERHKFFKTMEKKEERFNEILLEAEKMAKDGMPFEETLAYINTQMLTLPHLNIEGVKSTIEESEGEYYG